jgi:hypothetical protein
MEMKKCCICGGKGVKYIENMRIYNNKKRDIGYWVVCQCSLNKIIKQQYVKPRIKNKR